MKQVIEIIAKVLAWIGSIPAWLLPDKLKGYRTQLYIIISAITGIIATFTDMIPVLCTHISAMGIPCSPEAIVTFLITLNAALGAKLRADTNTPVFVSENAAGKK